MAWGCWESCLETDYSLEDRREFPGMDGTCRTPVTLQGTAQVQPFASTSLQPRAQVRKGIRFL